jgi:TolB protein
MRRITRGIDPACSPDGHQIAFAASESDDKDFPLYIYVMDADGTNKKQLTFGNDIGGSPSWSPDGTKIAFELSSGRIGIVDIGNGELTYPFTDSQWRVSDLSWSSLTSEIVFYGYIPSRTGKAIDAGLYISNSDGTNMRRLTSGFDDAGPDWSPDGQSIVFLHRETDSSDDILRIVEINCSLLQDIDLPTLGLTNPSLPKWSPDGQKVVFSAGHLVQTFFFGPEYRSGIFTINKDGSDPYLIRHPIGGTWASDAGSIPLPRKVIYGNTDWCRQ